MTGWPRQMLTVGENMKKTTFSIFFPVRPYGRENIVSRTYFFRVAKGARFSPANARLAPGLGLGISPARAGEPESVKYNGV